MSRQYIDKKTLFFFLLLVERKNVYKEACLNSSKLSVIHLIMYTCFVIEDLLLMYAGFWWDEDVGVTWR